MYAYHAYGDSKFLDIAISIWEEVNLWLITPDDAASGLHPYLNVSIPTSCNEGMVYHGPFTWRVNAKLGCSYRLRRSPRSKTFPRISRPLVYMIQ